MSATQVVQKSPYPQIDAATFGFDLNNREIAALLYIGALVLALLFWKRSRDGLGGVVKAFFQPKLAAIFFVMSLYVSACTALLAFLKFWDWSNLKTTLLWWLTAGFAAVFKASQITGKPGAFSSLVRGTLTWTAIITFIAEVHSLPLLAELALLPVLAILSLVLALSQARKEHAVLVGPLTWVLSFAGIFLIAYSVRGIIADPTDFFEWHQAREFMVPLMLSLMFLPFVFGVASLMAYETTFTSLSFKLRDERLLRYARWHAVLAFGFDTNGVKRLTRDIHMRDIVDRAGVDSAIAEIKRLKRLERNPPAFPSEDGWSPYEANCFLEAHNILTDDYHRSFDDEWFAHAPSVKLSDRSLPDHILYSITGDERGVTRLRLALDASYQNDTEEADEAFYERARTLLTKAIGEDQADILTTRVRSNDRQTFEANKKRITVEWSEWGIEKRGGYNRNLVIIHERRPPDPLEAYG